MLDAVDANSLRDFILIFGGLVGIAAGVVVILKTARDLKNPTPTMPQPLETRAVAHLATHDDINRLTIRLNDVEGHIASDRARYEDQLGHIHKRIDATNTKIDGAVGKLDTIADNVKTLLSRALK